MTRPSPHFPLHAEPSGQDTFTEKDLHDKVDFGGTFATCAVPTSTIVSGTFVGSALYGLVLTPFLMESPSILTLCKAGQSAWPLGNGESSEAPLKTFDTA